MFPRRIRGGLIETYCWGIYTTEHYVFPRRIRRGLIEARRGGLSRGGWSGFRDECAAPSCKPVARPLYTGVMHSFRDECVAASLKHGEWAAFLRCGKKFPRRIRRGLIEAVWGWCCSRVRGWFPRRIRRGLIE